MRKGIIVVCLSVIFVIGGVVWAADDHRTYENFGDQQSHDVTQTDNRCWAAASANILDWAGWDVGMSDQGIYEEFQKYWTDQGGLMKYAWQWWFDGTVPCWLYQGSSCPSCPGDWATVQPGSGNYLKNGNFFEYYCYYEGFYKNPNAQDDIKCLLDKGYGVTLTAYREGALRADPGHVYTLWGYNDDATFLYTDSDVSSPTMALETLSLYYDNKWRVVDANDRKLLVEGVHALKSPEAGDCGICAGDAKFAVVKKTCVDPSGEKEIGCTKGNNGTIIIESEDREKVVCDSECTRFIVPFSENSVLTVRVILDRPDKDEVFWEKWVIGGNVTWKQISNEVIEIQTTTEDFCLRPVIRHTPNG